MRLTRVVGPEGLAELPDFNQVACHTNIFTGIPINDIEVGSPHFSTDFSNENVAADGARF